MDDNLPSFWKNLQGVEQQIEKDLHELLAITRQSGRLGLELGHDANPPPCCSLREQLHCPPDDGVEVLDLKLRRSGAGALEQRGNEAVEAVRLADDEAGHLLTFRAQLGFAPQHLG